MFDELETILYNQHFFNKLVCRCIHKKVEVTRNGRQHKIFTTEWKIHLLQGWSMDSLILMVFTSIFVCSFGQHVIDEDVDKKTKVDPTTITIKRIPFY